MSRISLDGLWPILLLAAAAYLLFMALIYFSQSRLLYQPNLPSRTLDATPHDRGLPYESVRFRAADGVELHGWFLPAPDSEMTLLFFHGNAGNISHRLDSLRQLYDMGLSLFIFDYRGYGESEGVPGESGSYSDAEGAWRYLTRERRLPAARILLFGRSLGGAVATWLASSRSAAGLIVESSFTSLPDLAAEIYPWLPVRLLARLHYPSLRRIGRVNMPVLVVHSLQDEVIGIEHGRRLYAAASLPKQFLEISGGHNDGAFTSGSHYTRGVRHFLETLTPQPRD